ncbi:MAG: DUF2065 domain-containing protein [Stenotrophobium sp.]
MNWQELVRALALVMVIEGLAPFATPVRWRMMLLNIAGLESRTLRVIGLLSMLAGIALLQTLN